MSTTSADRATHLSELQSAYRTLPPAPPRRSILAQVSEVDAAADKVAREARDTAARAAVARISEELLARQDAGDTFAAGLLTGYWGTFEDHEGETVRRSPRAEEVHAAVAALQCGDAEAWLRAGTNATRELVEAFRLP